MNQFILGGKYNLSQIGLCPMKSVFGVKSDQ